MQRILSLSLKKKVPEHRVPPHNIEAEKSVLGSVLLDNESAHQVSEILRVEDFYKPIHREIFRSILDLLDKNEPADLVTLTNVLQERGELEKSGWGNLSGCSS